MAAVTLYGAKSVNPFLSRYTNQPQPSAPPQAQPVAMPQASPQAIPQQAAQPQAVPAQPQAPADMAAFTNAMRLRFQGTPLAPHFDYLHGLHQATQAQASQAAQAGDKPAPVGTPAMLRPALANYADNRAKGQR